MKQKLYNFATALISILCVAALCMGLTYNAADKPTFNNGYAWTGHPTRDFAASWAVEMQALTEAGVALGTGKIFYVDSGNLTPGNGTSWSRAVKTLDEGVNLCTANRGDVIFIAQGHTETMGAAADEVDIDAHGVTIIGMGRGTLRPLFDYTGDVSAAFTIGADNITIKNCVFNANILDVNDGIYIAAGSTDCAIIDCAFTVTAAGTDEFHESINSAGAASDRLTIQGCLFRMEAGAAEAALHMLDIDGLVFRNNVVQGTYTTAPIFAETTLSTDVLIVNNIFDTTGTGDTFNLVAASTGVVLGNTIVFNAAAVATAMDIGNCLNISNTLIADDDVGGAKGEPAFSSAYASVAASADD